MTYTTPIGREGLIKELEDLKDCYGSDQYRYSRKYSKYTHNRSEQEIGDGAWREAIEEAIRVVERQKDRRLNPE